MNFSTALTLILSATSSISAASQSSSSNNNLRGLSETIAYNAEDHDGLPESTYNALVSNRIETINYWTPENIANAEYRGLHGVVNGENSGVGTDLNNDGQADDGSNSTTIDYTTTTNDEDVRRLQSRVADSGWTRGGDVLKAAGRLMFRMGGGNYVCSATAVTDNNTPGRSVIITAGHCVYDQPTKRFGTSFLFIPNQDDGGGDDSDRNCNNDVYGCWTPAFAVIDSGWRNNRWTDNIPYDYAYLTVSDQGSHSGPNGGSDIALDAKVPALDITFDKPNVGNYRATALGYSARRDPDFRYCVQNLQEQIDVEGKTAYERGGYLLNGCYLTGGASGGPWCQPGPDSNGRCDIISVNSYGPGGNGGFMGGPRLYGNSAECLYEFAQRVSFSQASGGIVINWNKNNCLASRFTNSRGTTYNGLPTPSPTRNPTPNPTPAPTPKPTPAPTPNPTPAPSNAPSSSPSSSPTSNPTAKPVISWKPITDAPTDAETSSPTITPAPTDDTLTLEPSVSPSKAPTSNPTTEPSVSPTKTPTKAPIDVVPAAPAPVEGCSFFASLFGFC